MTLVRRGIRSRIYGGFAILVALGVALAVFATRELLAIQTDVGKMSALSDNSTRALLIGHDFETLQRTLLRYKFDADEAALKEEGEAAARAVELLQEAAIATLSEERRRTYNGIEADIGTLQGKREDLIRITKSMQADHAKLSSGGSTLSERSDKLLAAARATPDRTIVANAATVENAVLLVRVAILRFLAVQDPNGQATFKASVGKAHQAIDALESSALPDDMRVLVAPVRSALSDYAANFENLAASILKSNDLYLRELVPQTVKMQQSIGGAEASLQKDFAGTRTLVDESINGTITTQEIIAAATLLIGGIIAFLIGRSIVLPVAGMTAAMGRLAAGDTDVEVPSRDSTDEIGSMATAVEVFRQNAIERARLQAEHQATEARAAAQRKADMSRLANEFQAAVGGIVDTVSSASTELEAAATTLTRTAERTQQLTAVVTSASEEASANVQSVAEATTALTSSVSEIALQVQASSRIAAEAVKQAQKTDARIAELSQAASRIGDVVKLITAIAEQTNLLALNATIEAARAGEAGKGFAVVAQEVKALAAQTAKATDEIGTQITGMQSATQESVAAIKEIGGTIGRISEIASTISAAVDEQGAATGEIASNVQQASHGTLQVATNITDVNHGAGETGSASAQVLSSARSLSSESNRLKLEVERFLATVRAA
jgi:methyl-accepting chemotaxis protein